MNTKKSNKITAKQEAKTPSAVLHGRNKILSFKLEIMDDENIYSISFDAKLTEEEAEKILEAVQGCLYEKIADNIQMYLEQHRLLYTSFTAGRKSLKHVGAMKLVSMFLHSDTCRSIDRYTGNADIYYAVIDHQQAGRKNNYEGCYIAARKIPTLYNGQYRYSVIGQTFHCNEITCEEKGYFAIRKNNDYNHLYNLDQAKEELVLPTFGCIDLMALLLNIDHIQTIWQAEEIAVK